MRVRRKKILRPAMQVGKVAAPTAGDQDFLADAIGVFQHGDAASALAGSDGAHQTGSASAQDHRIVGMDHKDSFTKTVSRFNFRVPNAVIRGPTRKTLQSAKMGTSPFFCNCFLRHGRCATIHVWKRSRYRYTTGVV